jgi:hypothetical protein
MSCGDFDFTFTMKLEMILFFPPHVGEITVHVLPTGNRCFSKLKTLRDVPKSTLINAREML